MTELIQRVEYLKQDLQEKDFCSDNGAPQKKVKRNLKPYNTTHIETWNFLTNMTYNGLKSEDFCNRKFIFGVYVLLTKNVNPFSIKKICWRKHCSNDLYSIGKIAQMIYILNSFYKFMSRHENFLYFNGIEVLYTKTAEILLEHVDENFEIIDECKNALKSTT